MHKLTYELPSDLISKIKILPQNSLRMEIEPFLQCTISHKNQNLSQIYCPRLYLKILDLFQAETNIDINMLHMLININIMFSKHELKIKISFVFDQLKIPCSVDFPYQYIYQQIHRNQSFVNNFLSVRGNSANQERVRWMIPLLGIQVVLPNLA